ncbi:DUF1640 domain-containing protein [Herbaspirillum lusitanum]|uniref:DUF1640 domain-containing protein n=1 Tax=Herbaspirillum TaxID=963 RepID=UPI00027239FA|nr:MULTISPECIES: DUF1640 domain-containing protein [Herbaspirillum]EJL90443.1 hypothetical protein PMI16_01841 [Herbaspirillum sp. CF444]MCW5298875.1 DUF1640 domain-containing protein [Herbaspirillum lusitanum]
MTTVTFDTHQFIKKLEAAGLAEAQAEAISEAIKTASDTADTVSKKDLQIELAPIRTDLTLMKWMLGLIVAGVAALVLKSFF